MTYALDVLLFLQTGNHAGSLDFVPFILTVWTTKICPPTCQCLGNLTTLVCKEKTLQHMPMLPDTTEELYVSYNEIQEIPEQGLEGFQVSKTIASTTTFKNIFSLHIHIKIIWQLTYGYFLFYLITIESNVLLLCLLKARCNT